MKRIWVILAILFYALAPSGSITYASSRLDEHCSATATANNDGSVTVVVHNSFYTSQYPAKSITVSIGAITGGSTSSVQGVYDDKEKTFTFTFPASMTYGMKNGPADFSVFESSGGRAYCQVPNDPDGDGFGTFQYTTNDTHTGPGPGPCLNLSGDQLEACKARGRIDPCISVPSIRHDECTRALADSNKEHSYNSNPCLSYYSQFYVKDSSGNPVYNSLNCRTQRAQQACQSRTSKEGTVYVKAFGSDPEHSCTTFLGFTKTIIDYSLVIASIICGFMFLQGGFKYTISRGSPAGLIEARDQIMHATIGLVLLATAYIIILFLQGSFGFLGVDLIGPFGGVFGS